MSELVMAEPGRVGPPLKSGSDRCTTTPRAAEMTKKQQNASFSRRD